MESEDRDDGQSQDGTFRDEEVQEIVAPSAVVKETPPPVPTMTKGKSLPRLTSAVIDINQLSPDVAETLRQFDINGDGKISVTELVHGAMTQVEQQEKVIFFRRMLIAIFIGWLLTMGAMFGVVYGAIEASKESKVDSENSNKPGATMVTKDNAYVVQTANSDFFVGNDGSAYVRSVTSQQLEATEGTYTEGEAVNYNVLKTSAATANVTFSSNIPDSLLPELKHITIHSAIGATLSLNVHGALRMPTVISDAGLPQQGALTLLTHIGRIVVDGASVSCFDDTQAQIFESAGFIVANVTSVTFDGTDGGERRRLLDGIVALYGIFNAVADLSTWYNAQSYANQPPPKLPQNFIMYSRRYAPCIAFPTQTGAAVPYTGVYTGGTLPSDPGTDFCALLNVPSSLISTTYKDGAVLDRFIEVEYSIFRLGKEHLRVEYVHPLHPNVTYVEVLDTTDPARPVSFHYNVDTATKGMRIDGSSTEVEVPVFVGPVYYYNTSSVTEQNLVDQALSSPFDYLGTTTLQGEEVRVWALHLNDNKLHAMWYDSVSTQTVRRISYGDFGMMDVTAVIPIVDAEVSAMSYLFNDPAQGVTVIKNGTMDYFPKNVGVNPYEPFVDRYRELVREQDRQRSSRARRVEKQAEPEDVSAEVPPELLIPDAHLLRPSSTVVDGYSPSKRVASPTKAPSPRSLAAPSMARAATQQQVFAPTSRSQAKNALAAVPTASPTHYCPQGWVGSADTCYYFADISYQVTWTACRDFCTNTIRGSMLCIKDDVENRLVFQTITAMAQARGLTGRDTWIGLSRNPSTTNEYTWESACGSSINFPWAPKEPTRNNDQKYAAMVGLTGYWKDEKNDQSYRCVCQNPYNPSAAPTATPTTAAPSRAPTRPTARPTAPLTRSPTRPTVIPTSPVKPTARPSVSPTTAVATRNPTRSGQTRSETFMQLPQLSPLPEPINLISRFVYSKIGCLADNKCSNEVLWFQSFHAPFLPVLSVYGNYQIPCTFATVISAPAPIPVFPVIEIQLESGIEISFCNDMSALDYIIGTVTVSVAITGMDFVPAPFDEILTYQIASAGYGVTFLVVEWWCEIDSGGNIDYFGADNGEQAKGLLRRLAAEPRGRQMCNCLEKQQTYPGILNVVGGPDIPGIVLAVLPPFIPLVPFLSVTRIRQSATLETYPNVCELGIARTTLTIDVHLNIGIFIYSVTVYSIAEKHAAKSGSANFVGAYSESPKGFDMLLSQGDFLTSRLEKPFNDAGAALVRLINKGNIVWSTIVALGGQLANAATTYFQMQIDAGAITGDAVNAYARDLYNTFKPPPVVVYGCFDIRVTPPRCSRSIRVLGRRVCVRYSLPELTCGSDTKCIKYCN